MQLHEKQTDSTEKELHFFGPKHVGPLTQGHKTRAWAWAWASLYPVQVGWEGAQTGQERG